MPLKGPLGGNEANLPFNQDEGGDSAGFEAFDVADGQGKPR